MHRHLICRRWLLIALTGLAGCFGPRLPDQFYMLHSLPGPPLEGGGLAGDPLIGLGPVRIPAYLDRPQIVTAISASEYRLNENQRWAERLDVTITRVSAENLAALLRTDRIVVHPWPREPRPSLQASINIQEMHVDALGKARLVALWSLRAGSELVVNRRFSCSLPASASDHARMVESESECLARLNRDMAIAIRTWAATRLKELPESTRADRDTPG